MGRHEDQVEVHVVNRWTHADAAARAAQAVVTADIGKVSWQTDDSSLWWLSDTGPDWIQFAGGDKGDTGADSTVKGDTGVQGDPGDTGADSTVQGDTGDQGDTGAQGGFGGDSQPYNFDTATAEADPGSGDLRYNNATPASVTKIFADDDNSDAVDIQAWLRTIDDQASTIPARIRIFKTDDQSVFHVYDVSSLTEEVGYFDIDVVYVAGNGTFSDTDPIVVSLSIVGDQGDTGADSTVQGDTGDTGDQGDTGVQGDTGAGVQGDTGTSYSWEGAWVITTAYIVNDTVENNGSGYVCISAHTSSASDEPGVGASWETFWDVFVEKGDTGTGVLATGEIYLTSAGGWPSSTNGCAANTKNEYPTNDIDLFSLDFDGASTEFAQWSVWMPDDWDGGTITADFIWTAISGSGTVIWGLQGRSYANDEAIDQVWGTAQEVTDTLLTVDDFHFSPTTAAITLSGTPAAGEFVQFRAHRDGGTDTHAADARLLGVKVYYTRT